MADKMPWEMTWNGSGASAPQPQQAETAPMPQPSTDSQPKPWEMDWGSTGNTAAPATDEGTSWGIYNSDDGSILDTAGSGLNRQYQNTLAALVNDPETSRYQLRKAKQASQEYMKDSSKLGVAGNVAAGALTYTPVIAAGIVNPAAGAAVLGASTTAESLAAQQENNQDYDIGSATMAGLGSAGIELATAGVAGRVGNVAKNLSRPVTRTAAEMGTVGTQAAASSAGSQAMINLASGRPWDENLGEAAAIGGVAGVGIHGGLRGVNKALNLRTTPQAEAAVGDVRTLSTEAGFQPHESFTRGVHDYTNLTSNLKQDISNAPFGESTTNVDALVNAGITNPEGNVVALKDAAKAAKDFGMPVTSNFFNFDVNGRNAATDYLGLNAKTLTKDGQNVQHAVPSLFNRSKAQEAGETKVSWEAKFKKGYDTALNTFKGNADSNVLHISTLLDSDSSKTAGTRPQLIDLKDSLGQYRNYVNDAIERGSIPSDEVLGHYARKIYNLGNETGTYGDLINPLTGKAGDFDPVTNLKSLKMFYDGSRSNYPSVRDGTPNVQAEKGGYFQPTIVDAAGLMMGTPLVTAAKVAKKVLGAGVTQRHLRGTKARGADILDAMAREPVGFRNKAAQEGDFAAGAHEAAADLNDMGINTGGAENTVPLSTRTDVTPNDLAAQPVRTPEVAPEPVPADVVVQPDVVASETPTINPDTLTGRNIRDHEANLAAQRAAEESAPAAPIDPEVAAAQRAAEQAALTERARVDSTRRNTHNTVEDDGSLVSHYDDGTSEVTRPATVEEAPVETPAPRGNSDAELTALAARMERERQAAQPVEQAPAEPTRGNADSTLTREAARMESSREASRITKAEKARHAELMAKQDSEKGLTRGEMDEFDNLSQKYRESDTADAQAAPEATPVSEEGDSTARTAKASDEAHVDSEDGQPISEKGEPKVKASELVRRPVDELVNRVKQMSNKERQGNTGLINKAYQAREKLNRVNDAIDDFTADGRHTPEEVWGMINRNGGLDAFEDGGSVKNRLNSIARKDKDATAKQAESDSKEATKTVDEVVNKKVGKDMDEVLTNMKKDFLTRNIPEDVFEEAKTRASNILDGEYQPEHVANQVKEIMKERAKAARDDAIKAKGDKAKPEPKAKEEKPVERTMEDSYQDLKGYADSLGAWGDPEVRAIVKKATQAGTKGRKAFKPVSQGKEQSVYNAIDKHIQGQIDAYEAALAAPNVEQHAELANWRRKLANLKDKRENAKSSSDWMKDKVDARERDAKAAIARQDAKQKRADSIFEEANAKATEAEDASKAADKAAEEFDTKVNDAVNEAKETIQENLKDVSDSRIQNAALEATGAIPDYVMSKYDPDFLKYKAMMGAASDSLKARGLNAEAKAIAKAPEILEKALTRKEQFPHNPEYWLSATDIKGMKDTLNEGVRANSWYGDLYQRLRIAVYGSDKTYEVFSDKIIQQKLDSAKKRKSAGDVAEGGIGAAGIK